MQLTEILILVFVPIIVVGSIILLVAGLLRLVDILVDRDLRKNKNIKMKTKGAEDAIQELIDLHTQPHKSEKWFDLLNLVWTVGFIIFLIIAFISCCIQTY
jgi:hypothetical protein